MKLKLRSAALAGIVYALSVSVTSPAIVGKDLEVSIIGTPGAPVALIHCASATDSIGEPSGSDTAINRGDVFLISYVVR